MELLRVLIKGFIVGSTLTVPGVSGGSMALILGIYSPLIHNFNGLFRRGFNKLNCLKFIGTFSVGAGLGVFFFSRIVLNLMALYPLPITFLFAGAVVGGFPVIMREFRGEVFYGSDVVFPLLGIALVLGVASFSSEQLSLQFNNPMDWVIQAFFGLIAAVALVLPGVSFSHVLYIFGLYSLVFGSIAKLEFLPLIPFMIGLIFGVIFASRLFENLMVRFHKGSYLLTFGFVIGSVILLFENAPVGKFDLYCLLMFICGFASVFLISKKRTH